jgi:hypothetical protein
MCQPMRCRPAAESITFGEFEGASIDGAIAVEPLELELEVGETVLVGEHMLTVMDVDGDHVTVRIDLEDEFGLGQPLFDHEGGGERGW